MLSFDQPLLSFKCQLILIIWNWNYSSLSLADTIPAPTTVCVVMKNA